LSTGLPYPDLIAYLADCRERTVQEIRRSLPARTPHDGGLWEIALD
jgi:hypothetical protein